MIVEYNTTINMAVKRGHTHIHMCYRKPWRGGYKDYWFWCTNETKGSLVKCILTTIGTVTKDGEIIASVARTMGQGKIIYLPAWLGTAIPD